MLKIGRLLQTWMGERALRDSHREMDRFIRGLGRLDDRELGAMVAVATTLRINLENHGEIPRDLFESETLPSPEQLATYQMRLNRLARRFARDRQPEDAAAAMIWSYSLRALNVPELRGLGRALWAELARGFSHAEAAIDAGEARRGTAVPDRVRQGWRMIPLGLERMD